MPSRAERPERWWGHSSPWLGGLIVLLLIGLITATQAPRLARLFSGKGGHATRTGATPGPPVSGRRYTQAMIGGRAFAHADLRGAVLAHLDLRGANLRKADAAGAVLDGSLLNGANLSHADLRGADLRDACLRGAILSGAQMEGADFTGADTTDATVTRKATVAAIGWGSVPTAGVCGRG